MTPALPKNANLLLVNDPFEEDAELPHSVLRLRYNDPGIRISRLNWKPQSGKIYYPPGIFDRVFLFTGENVWRLPADEASAATSAAGQPLPFVQMSSKLADLSIVKDVGGRDNSPHRWVNQDPELAFSVPKLPARFEMTYTVPNVITDQTGPLDIEAWIANRPAPAIHIAVPRDYTYTAPLPPNLKTGEVVTVRFHVRNPYVSKGDGAKLAFLLTGAGFVSQ